MTILKIFKANFILLASLIVFQAFSLNTSAQTDFRPGYIIKKNLDTLNGYIDYRGDIRNSTVCSFKKNSDAVPTEYLPTDLAGYRFENGKYYVSQLVTVEDGEKQVFLEFLVNGIVDLYYYRGFENDYYFLKDKTGQMLPLEKKTLIIRDKEYQDKYFHESKKYLGILKIAFNDCPEINREINNTTLNRKSLMKITEDYHNKVCTSEKCIVYEKKDVKPQIKIGAFAGMNISYIHFGDFYYSQYDFDRSLGYVAGISLERNAPNLSERLFIEGIIDAGHSYYYSYRYTKGVSDEYIDKVHNSQTILQEKGLAKVVIPFKTFLFSINGGICFQQTIDQSAWRESARIVNGNTYTHTYYDVPRLGFVGPVAGVEFMKDMGKKLELSCRSDYSYLKDLDTKSYINSVCILAGIHYIL